MLKNDLLLRALAGESLTRPPVWMMRQAGLGKTEGFKANDPAVTVLPGSDDDF